MLSGGKDSTALAIRMKEEGWIVDEYIFCDTGKEFPAMYVHLDKLEVYLDIKITRLKSLHSFEYFMNNYVKIKGKSVGCVGYGWPQPYRWCTSRFKISVANKYLKKYPGRIEYHGVAIDEWNYNKNVHRAMLPKQGSRTVLYPLCLWSMSESDCLELCYSHGFDWDGLYEDFDRVSCFCCPHKSISELKTLYFKYPDLWAKIEEMDDGKNWMFKGNQPISYWAKKFDSFFSSQSKQLDFGCILESINN